MGKRIVFEFLLPVESNGNEWKAIKQFLKKIRAEHVTEPTGSSPYTLTAIISEKQDLEKVLNQLRAMSGIGRAEADAPREAF